MKAVLHNVDPLLFERLMRAGHLRKFSEGEQVFAESESALFLPIVISGAVKMVRYPEIGKEVIIGIFREGEIFAIPPALDGKKYPATAIAIEPSELLLLPRPKFLELMKESSEFSAIIMSRMCGLLRDMNTNVQILATPSSEQRICAVLLNLTKKDGTVLPLKVPLRRQDIAEMSGLTTETTIRSIRKLATKGLISIDRGKIIVNDSKPLADYIDS